MKKFISQEFDGRHVDSARPAVRDAQTVGEMADVDTQIAHSGKFAAIQAVDEDGRGAS
ncbi:hypothetical protein SDC9_89875 [bioreactor metagenome]|uniref:Uncharacterized protein n=1 Tax=bioreactor metagenome TaxID=1076179 RepID=A0A644ZQR2_9ZZZZ